MPVAVQAKLPRVMLEYTLLVPPTAVRVPAPLEKVPIVTNRADTVPFDTVIWPLPELPMMKLFVAINCPPVIHTVPLELEVDRPTRC